MITKVQITDNSKLPLKYAKELDAFKNGKEYNFKGGVNVIIGKNGSGKTTLMKMIAMYMLCNDSLCSRLPNFANYGALKLNDIFKHNEEELLDGIKIMADYAGVVYNCLAHNEMKNEDILDNITNMDYYLSNNGASTGETTVNSVGQLFKFAFSNKNIQFPLQEIMDIVKNKTCNDFWEERLTNLLKYYRDNRDNFITQQNFEYTFLLDEPDRNLDITNIDSVYEILSHRKEMTQLITVIHNPVLIYKLSKVKGKNKINFIELTDGYLNDIKNVFEDLYSKARDEDRER